MSGSGSKKMGNTTKGGKSKKKFNRLRVELQASHKSSPVIPSRSIQSHTSAHIQKSSLPQASQDGNCSNHHNIESPPLASELPPIIPTHQLLSRISSLHARVPSLPQRSPDIGQPQHHNTKSQTQSNQHHNTESQPQSNQSHPINPVNQPLPSPSTIMTPNTSCSVAGNGDDDSRIWIVPEADGFDPHKPVIEGIGNCIKSKFELAKPSWKKFPTDIRDMWFEEFNKKFRWHPCYNNSIRKNFEKRGSAKMIQLFQDVRDHLPAKPNWMGDIVFKEMKDIWGSEEYKAKSKQNKKNRDANAGASLHTGGCIPHRVHWKRMKEDLGKDPPIADFYFRTHKTKKDKSWVNEKAEANYINFENKKQELIASQSASMDQGDSTGQPSQLSEIDIWVQSVGGKRKGRVPGLGSLGRMINVNKQSTSTMSEGVDEMITQVQASNAELHAQLQKERRQNKKMKKELRKTNKILASLMEHVGYPGPSKEDNQDSEDNDQGESDYEHMSENDSDSDNLSCDSYHGNGSDKNQD